MSYLVNLVLRDRPAVVVGAGRIAARKIGDLLEAGARVTVVAPRVAPEVNRLSADDRIRLHRRPYAAGDLAGAALVVAATDDHAVNARVSDDARGAGVPVNVVDEPALCTFTIPAVVRRGDLTLAVATEGQCPAFARAVREDLETRYGAEYAVALTLLAEARGRLREAGWDSARVQRVLSELYRDGLVDCVRDGDERRLAELLRTHLGPLAPDV